MTAKVLFCDNHLLVVCKPAGLPVQQDRLVRMEHQLTQAILDVLDQLVLWDQLELLDRQDLPDRLVVLDPLELMD